MTTEREKASEHRALCRGWWIKSQENTNDKFIQERCEDKLVTYKTLGGGYSLVSVDWVVLGKVSG